MKTLNKAALAIIVLAISTVFISCTDKGKISTLQAEVDSLKVELQKFTEDATLTKQRLAEFDRLDYQYYSGQKWDKFSDSHADDIKVYYPDGSVTEGLYPEHIDALTPMFVFAPNTKIGQHPVSFGSGDWTAVIGVLEGTFSEPMPIGNGKTIPPTGKSFKLSMATIGHWKGDKMIEEYLFWDNQDFMKQIGLAQ